VPRRRIAALLVVFALALASCGDSNTPAISVGDVEVSEEDFFEGLDEWAGNEGAIQQILQVSNETSVPDGYSTELTSQVATFEILSLVHEQELERQGIELTDEDLDAVRGTDTEAADQVLGDFSDGYERRVLRLFAAQSAVQDAVGADAYASWFQDAVATVDIEVSSRFGTWDDSAGVVVPPQGPLDPAEG
jgi:hypothetical protein